MTYKDYGRLNRGRTCETPPCPQALRARRDNRAAYPLEWLAANSSRFMRIHRALSAVWGVMFLAYAVVRVVIIYSTTVSRAVWITEIPGIIAIGICLIVSRRAGKQLEALVNERLGRK